MKKILDNNTGNFLEHLEEPFKESISQVMYSEALWLVQTHCLDNTRVAFIDILLLGYYY